MATRRATRKYSDLVSFFADLEEHLSGGFCLLPADSFRGELAPEIKLDLMVPVAGRIGPITAQVVQRAPDGSVGLQLPDFEIEAGKSLQKLDRTVGRVRDYLVESGQLAPPVDVSESEADPAVVAELEARISELEVELANIRSATPGEQTAGAPDAPLSADGATDSPAGAPDQASAGEPDDDEAAPLVRGIPVPDLSRIEPDLEGLTEAAGLRNGVMAIAGGHMTGILSLQEESGVVRYGFFSAGGPVAWRSDPVQEREVLGMLLLQAGQISKEQLKQSLDLMQEKGIRQGEAFIEQGIMSFSQLIMVLGKQSEFIFQRLLENAKGTWTFHKMRKLPEAFLPPPVRVGAHLFRTLLVEAKNLRGGELAERLRPHINSYIQLDESRKRLFKDMGLRKQERRLIGIIAERTLRMKELFSMSPLSRQNTAGMFFALVELGMLKFGDRETRGRYLQRVSADIARKKRQLIQSTHFDVLEVHWISLPDEIESAYKRLKAQFSPAAFDDLPAELVEVLERIQTRFDDGYEVLKDNFQRREYRKTLVEEFMIVQSAQLLARKGEMAIMRNDRRLATSCFAKALELQPRSGEYRTSLQRARAVQGS